MRNLFQILNCSILALALSACGEKKDQEVTINTGIPVRSPLNMNLSQNLSNLMNVSVGNECYQSEFNLIIYDPAIDEIVASHKLNLRTKLSAAVPAPTPITYANNSADVTTVINRLVLDTYLDEPLKVLIPRDHNVEVGLLGHFYDPADADLDGVCDQTSGGVAISSSALFGHTLINEAARIKGSVDLNVDVMHTTPTGNYNLATPINRYKNWIQVNDQFTYSSFAARLKSISYLDGKVTVYVDNGTATKYYLPHLFPYTMTFAWSGGGNSGLYQAQVNNADPNGLSTTATLSQTLSGTPPSTINSAASAFNIISY